MSATCPDCGKTWGGRAEHCTVCHETFTGTIAGDRHRVGKHGVTEGPARRRCAAPTERGLVLNRHGVWGMPSDGSRWWEKHGDEAP